MTTAFPSFIKRRYINSSIDSICTMCLLTIGSARSEEELVSFENRHVCDLYGEFSDAFFDSDICVVT